ncbi:hypothetical protein [Chryseobacterium tongliaoense]|uniref:hypothetical protein n=1 Tax=Chryseobacterium tongliaoense TaxID=3240933 RepID=UPI00351451BF
MELVKNINFNEVMLFFTYFIINFLFLTKYGIRQSIIPIELLVFAFFVVNICFFCFRNNRLLTDRLNVKTVYLAISVITVLYLILCHLLNDPYQLNIDRWQTLEYSLEYWLKGKYIYDTPNFMGNFSSYLPGQLLLTVLFYWLGNVGYFQVGAFLLFSYSILYNFKNNFLRLQGILLLGVSLAFVYEVVCKSDFISSFLITASFLSLWHNIFKENYFAKPFLLGLCIGALCLTRSIVIISLIIFLLRPFLTANLSSKIKFCLGCMFSVSILLATVLLPAKDFKYILHYNPVLLQGQSNKFIMFFFILLAIVASFYVKKISDVFYFSSHIIFLSMLSFVLEQYFVAGYGYQNNFFSTTYLAACLPFTIIGYIFVIEYGRTSVKNIK